MTVAGASATQEEAGLDNKVTCVVVRGSENTDGVATTVQTSDASEPSISEQLPPSGNEQNENSIPGFQADNIKPEDGVGTAAVQAVGYGGTSKLPSGPEPNEYTTSSFFSNETVYSNIIALSKTAILKEVGDEQMAPVVYAQVVCTGKPQSNC